MGEFQQFTLTGKFSCALKIDKGKKGFVCKSRHILKISKISITKF